MNKKPRPRSRFFLSNYGTRALPLAARGSPLDGRPKQHQGLCPCKPALAAEGSGARGGEATPHTRAEAWGHCAPSSRIRLRRSYGRGTHPQGGGAPAIQLDRASFKTCLPGAGLRAGGLMCRHRPGFPKFLDQILNLLTHVPHVGIGGYQIRLQFN